MFMGEGCAFGYTNKTRIIAHVFLLFKKILLSISAQHSEPQIAQYRSKIHYILYLPLMSCIRNPMPGCWQKIKQFHKINPHDGVHFIYASKAWSHISRLLTVKKYLMVTDVCEIPGALSKWYIELENIMVICCTNKKQFFIMNLFIAS